MRRGSSLKRRLKKQHDEPAARVAGSDLFRSAVLDVTPLVHDRRAVYREPPPALPVQSMLDAQDALTESIAGAIPWEQSMETGEELVYLRAGLSREILRKLRRGHWTVQDEIDLHGLNRDQARAMLADFLGYCRKRSVRCLRIVHGKGLRSPGREPVLKREVKTWLCRRDEVMAFCQAPPGLGGSGALMVLLKS